MHSSAARICVCIHRRPAIAAGTLRFVPAQYASGGPGYTLTGYGNMHQHYADFSYTVSDGITTSAPATVNIDIAPVATAPTLTLGSTTATQRLFDTGWEDAPGNGQQPALVPGPTLDGWSLVTGGGQTWGSQNGFEVWANGDKMQAANGQTYTVDAAPGDGSKFLELDQADCGQPQALGITRQVNPPSQHRQRRELQPQL